jgi:hypothetical protein
MILTMQNEQNTNHRSRRKSWNGSRQISQKCTPNLQIIAGIRDFNSDKQKLSSCWIDFVKFGFLDATTYKLAL